MRFNLNPSQLEAVTASGGPVLVIAGAGSGKTRVIEYRVLHLVEEGVDPGSILLLTFTRRAAGEMLARASRHNPQCIRVEGGTFHSFAYKWLKIYHSSMGFPRDFSVLDEADSAEAVSRCCTRLGLPGSRVGFPKKRTLKKIIGTGINRNLDVKHVLASEYTHFADYAAEIEKLAAEYADFKKEKGYMDYDDMLVYFKKLLEEDASARERISGKYLYLMVDEYQDTNSLQGGITRLLASVHGNVMVVGDDAQSIYGFRGASHENIMRFPEQFPGCRIIKLEVNYRSTQPVLELANAVLESMDNKYSKCLVSARGQDGCAPGVVFFSDSYGEAAWVADRIAESGGRGLGEQGVLFRSSSVSIPLQAELIRRQIPFRVFGGLRFYETSHVKDMLSILRILASHRDELAWHRSLMLIEGIGEKTAERILKGVASAPSMESMLADSLAGYTEGYRFSTGLRSFEYALRGLVKEGRMPVAEKLGAVLDYYRPLMKKKFDDWPQRERDLNEIRNMAARYADLEKFLADFLIDAPGRGEFSGGKDPGEALTLSTIHSAKGLEWESVYFMGLVEGVLPVGQAMEDEGLIEEERRLFYVGITRARTRLCLTANFGRAGRWDSGYPPRASRFLEAPGVLECLQPVSRIS